VGPYTGGKTARISKISPAGVRTTVVDGLPLTITSKAIGSQPGGVGDVAFVKGTLYALTPQGLDALDLWLDDLLRQGLATVETQPATFWERQAARMVDAQAPGIAARLQEDVRQAIGWTLKEEDVLAGGEVVADAGRGGCSSVSSSRRARSGATISE
jgi:hypothetical protein